MRKLKFVSLLVLLALLLSGVSAAVLADEPPPTLEVAIPNLEGLMSSDDEPS